MFKLIYAFNGNFYLGIVKVENDCLTLMSLRIFKSFFDISDYITDGSFLCIDKENASGFKFPKVKFVNLVLKPVYFNLERQYFYEDYVFKKFKFNNLQLRNKLKTLTVHQEFSMVREFIIVLYKFSKYKQEMLINNYKVQQIFG